MPLFLILLPCPYYDPRVPYTGGGVVSYVLSSWSVSEDKKPFYVNYCNQLAGWTYDIMAAVMLKQASIRKFKESSGKLKESSDKMKSGLKEGSDKMRSLISGITKGQQVNVFDLNLHYTLLPPQYFCIVLICCAIR